MFRLFSRYWSITSVVALLVEAGLTLGALWAAHLIRAGLYFGFAEGPLALYSARDFWSMAALVTGAVLFFIYAEGLYEFRDRIGQRELGIRLLRAHTFAGATVLVIYFLIPNLALGRGVFFIGMLLILNLLFGWRVVLMWSLRRRLFSERVLIVGSDDSARDLATEILRRRHLGYRVVGFLTDDPALQGVSIVNPKVIGMTSNACELALAHQATRVVVAQHDSRGQVSLNSLLACKTSGISVERGSDYYEQLTGKVLLDGRRIKSWLIFSQGFVISRSTLIVKRMLDLLVAAVGLVLAAPLMLVIALAVKLESRGPVFYRQERVGRHEKPFILWKFRSMADDAEKAGGAQWAAKSDSRVTRLGKVLRKSRLDELPQLWNVLNGSMSFVGPRPERRVFVDQLQEVHRLYQQRHKVRPGLTGWAQIMAPYAASVEESIDKLGFDLYYLKNLSVFLDLSIIASTLRIVLVGRGAR